MVRENLIREALERLLMRTLALLQPIPTGCASSQHLFHVRRLQGDTVAICAVWHLSAHEIRVHACVASRILSGFTM